MMLPPGWVCLRGAERVVCPATGVDAPGDVWLRDGLITHVATTDMPDELRGSNGEATASYMEIDATGLMVSPRFIDLHVHFREPGGEVSETLATGQDAALAGGYGLVYTMANTNPTCDAPEVAALVRRASTSERPVEIVPVSALSRGLRGTELVDLDAMAAEGVGAFSDDGAWLADERLARDAFRWAERNDQAVFQHCEDFGVTGPGVLHACACVHEAGLPGIASRGEVIAVERDIRLARDLGPAFHVCHLSTQGALEAVREAQARGERVTAEVTPHHLVLTAADALAGGTDFKMKPPLRDPSDVDALIDGLVDGTIGAIATDHAPHTDEAKARGLAAAPFGAIGLETAFPVLFTHLVRKGRVTLARLVAALTMGPATIAGRPAPALRVGAPADLVLVDLQGHAQVDRDNLRSRSRNCPFDGMDVAGWPVLALAHGRIHALRAGFRERIRTEPAPHP